MKGMIRTLALSAVLAAGSTAALAQGVKNTGYDRDGPYYGTQGYYYGTPGYTGYYGYNPSYGYAPGPVQGAANVVGGALGAAGNIAGAAVGTAGNIAGAILPPWGSRYDYYGSSYQPGHGYGSPYQPGWGSGGGVAYDRGYYPGYWGR